MHEFSIASDIVESVSGFAEAHPEGKVIAVRLSVGELMCVEPEQLRFCYETIVQGTPLAESQLEMERLAAAVKCPHCSYAGPPRYWDGALSGIALPTLQCPRCGRTAEATQGHECLIRGIRFELREAAGALF